jgi:D-alanyl-D-alanine carboxypeptidase
VALPGVVVALVLVAGPAARAQTTTSAVLAPKASILVDADTGAIIEGVNIHEPLPPASLSKIFTALAAVAALDANDTLTVSERAAGMPAHNMNMKQGQVWVIEDVLGALLVSSANDAGMALAERVSGSAEAFADALARTAARLGLADQPTLQDPSGLDDEFSIGGGNRVSARDMAIAARAVLAEPRLARIVASPVYSFTGGDGIAHRLGNHNRLLKVYAGAVGIKTGYTKRSLHSLAAAATRNGRTMIAVILDAPGDTYGPAAAMLDKGFATPVTAEPAAGRLPAVPSTNRSAKSAASAPIVARGAPKVEVLQPGLAATHAPKRGWFASLLAFLFKLMLGFATAVAILRVRVRTQQTRTLATRQKGPRTPPPWTKPKPNQQLTAPAMRTAVASMAPSPARPVEPARSGPRPSRPTKRVRPKPAHRRSRSTAEPPEMDPKLVRRFEILARTGQVVP